MAYIIPYVKILKNELQCSMCEGIFKDPRTLPCFHKFCFVCIRDFIARRAKKGQCLCCPICKKNVFVPEGDAATLPTSTYLNSLLVLLRDMKSMDINKEDALPYCVSCKKRGKLVAFCLQCDGTICTQCLNRDGHQETMFKDFKKENVNSYIRNQVHCQEKLHEKDRLEYFCQSCSKCVCQKCASTDHQVHDKMALEEAARREKKSIDQEMNEVKQLKEKYEKEREVSKQNMERYGREIDAAIRKVRDTTKAYMKMIQDHETLMIATLNSLWFDQKAATEVEQKGINTGMSFLADFDLKGQAKQDQKVAHFILQSQHELPMRSNELMDKPSVLFWHPSNRDIGVEYVSKPCDQLKQMMRDLGKIVESVTEPSSVTI